MSVPVQSSDCSKYYPHRKRRSLLRQPVDSVTDLRQCFKSKHATSERGKMVTKPVCYHMKAPCLGKEGNRSCWVRLSGLCKCHNSPWDLYVCLIITHFLEMNGLGKAHLLWNTVKEESVPSLGLCVQGSVSQHKWNWISECAGRELKKKSLSFQSYFVQEYSFAQKLTWKWFWHSVVIGASLSISYLSMHNFFKSFKNDN